MRSFRTLIFSLSLCLELIFRLEAQNGITGNPDWFIKPVVNYGFIYEHRATLGHLVKGYPYIVELNIGKPAWGHKLWHCENNLPDIGINVSMIDFRNPSQLGYAFSIAPYAEIPLNATAKRSRVVMRLCWGVAYLNKCFDVKTNPKNIAIGSHINSFVQFRWFWHLQLSKRLRFEPGFTFSHCSNARAAVPNLGLNVVTLNAGFNYSIPSKSTSKPANVDSLCRAQSRHEILVYGAFGYNQREVDADHYYCALFSAEYHFNKRNTHKFGFGTDVFIDQNYLIDYKQDLGRSATGLDNTRITAKFCYSYNIGRISFPVDIGYYVYEKTHPDGPVCSRIGVKYYTSSNLVFSVGLRTHFAVAYDFEYGIGYRFNLKKKR
jgi:hypothetical protein